MKNNEEKGKNKNQESENNRLMKYSPTKTPLSNSNSHLLVLPPTNSGAGVMGSHSNTHNSSPIEESLTGTLTHLNLSCTTLFFFYYNYLYVQYKLDDLLQKSTNKT